MRGQKCSPLLLSLLAYACARAVCSGFRQRQAGKQTATAADFDAKRLRVAKVADDAGKHATSRRYKWHVMFPPGRGKHSVTAAVNTVRKWHGWLLSTPACPSPTATLRNAQTDSGDCGRRGDGKNSPVVGMTKSSRRQESVAGKCY